MPRRFQAFTLIELLIVVVIIILLISILIPALSKGRDYAAHRRLPLQPQADRRRLR